jgi:uncharacterized protein (DUF1501 family)
MLTKTPNLKISRRGFLVGCSTAIAAMAGARLTQVALASPEGPDAPNYETLVVVFLRGGWDALNVLIPLGGPDRGYYETYRAQLKVPLTATQTIPAALALANATSNGTPLGFHPGLSPLLDLYQQGALAVVCAAGLTSDTRSHFDAMQYMELGTPGIKATAGGWITRHLMSSPNLPSTIFMPAVSAGSGNPVSLSGYQQAVALSGVGGFNYRASWDDGINVPMTNALRQMYSLNGSSWLHLAGHETLEAIDVINGVAGDYKPAGGANYNDNTGGLGSSLRTVAQLIKGDLGLRAATVDYGGWDTHESQQNGNGDPRGYFFEHLGRMARAFMAFYTDLAATNHHRRVTMVVMSEFGRRVRENSNRGTDHGHGNALFVLGGSVNGGRVYGAWPGLSNTQLYQGDDIAITTDYRTVLSEILVKRAGNPNIATIFPNFNYAGPLGIVRDSGEAPPPSPTPGPTPTIDPRFNKKVYLPTVRR